MKLEFIGKNLNIYSDVKEICEKKLEKLNKYFADDILAKALFKTQKNNKILEVTIYLPDGKVLRSEQSSDDFLNAIDKVVKELDRQIRKHKTKLQKIYKSNETIRFDAIEELKEEDDSPKIVREKNYELRPMTREEAMLQIEMVKHDFFLFLDVDTNKVSVLYRRGDGDFGLIHGDI